MNSNRRIAFSFSNGNRGSERSHSVHVGHASKYYININSCLGWVVGPAHLQAGCYLLCSVPYRRAQSFGHEPLRRQGSSTTSRPPQPLSAQAIKHIWVRTALFEKVLDKIVQHIVDNSRWFLCFKLFFSPDLHCTGTTVSSCFVVAEKRAVLCMTCDSESWLMGCFILHSVRLTQQYAGWAVQTMPCSDQSLRPEVCDVVRQNNVITFELKKLSHDSLVC